MVAPAWLASRISPCRSTMNQPVGFESDGSASFSTRIVVRFLWVIPSLCSARLGREVDVRGPAGCFGFPSGRQVLGKAAVSNGALARAGGRLAGSECLGFLRPRPCEEAFSADGRRPIAT